MHHTETLYRLGTNYVGYRLFLACGLFLIFFTTQETLISNNVHPLVYTGLNVLYVVLCIASFLLLKFYKERLQTQFFIYLIIDIVYLTLVLFISAGPNIITILLYMIVVLAATMLLSPRKALGLTLLSILAVVYQQFFLSLYNVESISFYGASALITLIFIATHALGQIAIKRMQVVENIANDQHTTIVQLQHIHQSIIEQLDTGFMVIDQQGLIISLNKAARQYLALPSTPPEYQQNLAFAQPELYQAILKKCSDQGRGIFQFFLQDLPDGLSIEYRPIALQQQQFTLLMIESLNRLNQHAQQARLASLGQLSASIAHEIRNPLAAISQANELLAFDEYEEQKQLTKMIHNQCSRINHIIEDTLNMSKQKQTMLEHIDFHTWFKVFVQDDLSDIRQFLVFDAPPALTLFFDPHHLRLVLINLIRNAIRHGHALQPTSMINIKAHHIEGRVCIDVIDQGAGISTQQQKKLFEPFQSTAVSGTGLGLYLSKIFCENNHAQLKYIPQTQGACFRVECSPNQQ